MGGGVRRARRPLTLAISVVALLAVLALPGGAGADRRSSSDPPSGSERARQAAEGVIPGSYIVVFEDSVRSVAGETGARERRDGFDARFRYRAALKGFAARLNARQVAKLQKDPEVERVFPNRRVRATAILAAGEQPPPSGVQRMRAATPNPGGTANLAASSGVAVIDTGVDLAHPDLNVVDGTNCVDPGSPAGDENGHGTHVAGSIAAENDGAGIVGVAPATKVHAVKVLDAQGAGTWAEIICGIDWVTANAAARDIKVANMSLGGLGTSSDNAPCGSSTPLREAICRSTRATSAGGPGVRYAVAAGNDGWAFPHSLLPDVPASYDEVVTVTALSDSDGRPGASGGAPTCRSGEADDRYASFSNYSDNTTDNDHTLAAPGVCIKSTWPTALNPAGGYHTISGTSMASPHAAGAIARCIGERTADGSTTSGPCAGVASPKDTIDRVVSKEPSYGFAGDPAQPVSGRYYGYLSLAGSPPAQPPSFTLSAAPTSRTINRGQRTTYAITVNRSNGFASPVSLSVSGVPLRTTASFSPNPASTSSTLNVTASSTAKRGTFNLTVKGVSGSLTRTTTVSLRVR